MNNIGRKAYFVLPGMDPNKVVKFSSTVEKIGVDNDCEMKNLTKVLIISEEETGNHPLLGEVKVVKVFANKEMWLPADSLVLIEESITNN